MNARVPSPALLTRPVLLSLCLLAACSESAPQEDAGGPAFRVRTDFDAPLNRADDLAASVSGPVTVTADQPFRLRIELEATERGVDASCLRLEYRRNDGDWIPLQAHDFPYPLRERELTFDAQPAGTVPEGWQIVAGDVAGLAVQQTDGEAVLQASASSGPVIGLYPAPWDLTGAFSFGAEYRLPAAGGSVGLVFGYRDPRNHWRLTLDADAGAARVIQVLDGSETVVAEQAASIVAGEWQQAEVSLEAGTLHINVNDDAVEFTVTPDGGIPADLMGFLVPEGGTVEFTGFAVEGEPSSPRMSIVSTEAFQHEAATQDLLQGSAAPYVPGVAVNLSECAPVTVQAGHHTELEWPLVIRRFADAAALNEPGDTFELRLAARDGDVVAGAPMPELALSVPAGHLGGTFVEAPGRIGPWQAANGDLYFIMEPAESDNLFMMVKSSDGGRSWHEVDGANRPATGDLESVDSRLVGDTIHILHQVTESTRYHAFRTADHPQAPDTWAVTDELATSVTARAQMATLAVRPDGTMVAFHVGDTVGYSIRSAAGEWSEETVIEDQVAELAGPQAVLGAEGVVHLAYYRMDGTIWYRRLLPDDTLTTAVQLDEGAGTGEDEWGAVLPLVYLPGSDTVVVLYRLADGFLWERRIHAGEPPAEPVQAVGRKVVQHAVDSQQAGADTVGHDGDVVVLFIDEGDRGIYSARHGEGGWEPPVLQVDGILGSWVRGNVIERADGSFAYGYVYDAGSFGGAGMNRYGELSLDSAADEDGGAR